MAIGDALAFSASHIAPAEAQNQPTIGVISRPTPTPNGLRERPAKAPVRHPQKSQQNALPEAPIHQWWKMGVPLDLLTI